MHVRLQKTTDSSQLDQRNFDNRNTLHFGTSVDERSNLMKSIFFLFVFRFIFLQYFFILFFLYCPYTFSAKTHVFEPNLARKPTEVGSGIIDSLIWGPANNAFITAAKVCQGGLLNQNSLPYLNTPT